MSRAPVAHYAWHKPRVSRHAFLEIVPATTTWRVFGVHLSAVHAAWTERRRVFELRALLRAVAAHQQGPHVLIGDFNTVAPGDLLDIRKLPHRLRTLVWLSGGQIRWKTIATVLSAGYIDAFRRLHPTDAGCTLLRRIRTCGWTMGSFPVGWLNRSANAPSYEHRKLPRRPTTIRSCSKSMNDLARRQGPPLRVPPYEVAIAWSSASLDRPVSLCPLSDGYVADIRRPRTAD
jgi:hypothetical protein